MIKLFLSIFMAFPFTWADKAIHLNVSLFNTDQGVKLEINIINNSREAIFIPVNHWYCYDMNTPDEAVPYRFSKLTNYIIFSDSEKNNQVRHCLREFDDFDFYLLHPGEQLILEQYIHKSELKESKFTKLIFSYIDKKHIKLDSTVVNTMRDNPAPLVYNAYLKSLKCGTPIYLSRQITSDRLFSLTLSDKVRKKARQIKYYIP